jgi:hypothetical protein
MEFAARFASLMTSLSNNVLVSPKVPTQMGIGGPVAKARSACSNGLVGPFVVSRGLVSEGATTESMRWAFFNTPSEYVKCDCQLLGS